MSEIVGFLGGECGEPETLSFAAPLQTVTSRDIDRILDRILVAPPPPAPIAPPEPLTEHRGGAVRPLAALVCGAVLVLVSMATPSFYEVVTRPVEPPVIACGPDWGCEPPEVHLKRAMLELVYRSERAALVD